MAVFTIPPEEPFLDALVAGLQPAPGADPSALARTTILLPTRRAVRALAESFLRASEGRALLLPKLVPVGDLDADELSLLGEQGADDSLDIPPAVPDLRRRLILTTLVLEWGRVQGTGPLTPGQAAPLAGELARFIDEVQAEGGSLDDLDRLVPDEHAEHWQKILKFLDIVRVYWPQELDRIGCIDPADRRNRLLAAQGAAWRAKPPDHPVIAAGVTGAVPAVADLLVTLAGLAQGTIVLPGLARDADAETWAQIAADPAHPQHVMAGLLRRLEIEPADVALWPCGAGAGAPPARSRVLFEALRPATSSERWREARIAASDLDGLRRLDCAGPQEEALAIAHLLRQRLEEPGKTAALVTPDRDCARRVAAELRRWNIEIDDSAGIPLERTPPGIFLRLVVEAAAEALAPVPLLALLKHPVTACGMAPAACRALARRLEMRVLRGPRPAPGLAGLRAALGTSRGLAAFVARIGAALAPLGAALAAPETSLARLVAAHLAAAEALARSDTESGAERLWREEAGEAAAQRASELIAAAAEFPPLRGGDYPALFEALLAGPVVRPPFGRHPRLFLWGLAEAQLQRADRLILGGLNEGVWPPETASDPWLSRPMRRSFGLPPPERRIGIAAHDFAQALGAPEVWLTRAVRVEGAPTVASRWLLRLDALLRGAGLPDAIHGADEPIRWARLADEAERVMLRPPAPKPPVAARPRRLSVTAIETWMRDPYAIYARHVLRLEALEPLDADPGYAERGIFIHSALDRFLNEFPDRLPADAAARLREFGRIAFGDALERPGVRAFWWPRFERIADWFLEHEIERRGRIASLAAEREGRLVLPGPAGPFELHGRADRIDRLRTGGLAVVDYKTGTVPKPNEVRLGFAPQLALEAAIAEAGGFEDVAPDAVVELAFWQLTGRSPAAGEEKPLDNVRRHIGEALAGLSALIARFDDPATPYRAVPRPEHAPRYSDYVHLSRVKEWSVVGDPDE